MVASITLVVTTATTLASTIVSVWKTQQNKKERALDREQARQLEAARFQHDQAMLEPRESSPSSAPTDTTAPLLTRLAIEANTLSERGFTVVYEPISDGYGLALHLNDSETFAFLIPPTYPYQPPFMLLQSGEEVDEIPMEQGTWSESMTLADIVASVQAGLGGA